MAAGGNFPTQTYLQKLLMNAQYYPGEMDEIRRLLEKRMLEKKSADYQGTGAAMDQMGKGGLEALVAGASGQQAPGTIGRFMEGDMPTQDVGGSGGFRSIWDAMRF